MLGDAVRDRVVADPALRRVSDRLVARWGTVGAVLSAGPVVLLAVRGLRDAEPPSPWQLSAFAVYGFALALVAGYPFQRIERLGTDP